MVGYTNAFNEGKFLRFFVFVAPFLVAFVSTVYSVLESEGSVEVCVNLTRPVIDILEETVRVEVYDFSSSVHIPADSALASESTLLMFAVLLLLLFVSFAAPDPLNVDGTYSQSPSSDYEQQFLRFNGIRDTYINATRRVICYDQPIYDDVRVEMSEFLGLTLAIRDYTSLTEVDSVFDQVAIEILDNDGKEQI